MKEAGFCCNRVVHALFTPPQILIIEQYGQGEMSRVVIFVLVYYFFPF